MLFSFVLTFCLWASGQGLQADGEKPAETSFQDARAQTSSDDCEPKPKPENPKVLAWDLIYPPSGAAYVGGTIPRWQMETGNRFWRWIQLRQRQLHSSGKVALSPSCLLFAFAKKNQNFESSLNANPNYHALLHRCLKVSLLDSQTTQITCEPGDGKGNFYVLAIPYATVNSLSRAKYATSDLASVSTTYATAGVGILGGLITNNSGVGILAGVGGSMAIYYYVAIVQPRVRDNYIAVFIEPALPQIGMSRKANVVTVTTSLPHDFQVGQEIQISDVASSELVDISKIGRDKKGTATVQVKDGTRLPPLGSQVEIVHVMDTSFNGQFEVASVDPPSRFTYKQKDETEASQMDRGGKVLDYWNGKFQIESIAGSKSFTYWQAGPNDQTKGTGTVDTPPESTKVKVKSSLAEDHPETKFDLTGTASISKPPAKSDDLFKKGDLVMFRIPNHHDYYNISMIMSAGTGLTFVPEIAEKSGK